ncbi:MAG: pitrilysin family protein [Planctomycetota bacterium]
MRVGHAGGRRSRRLCRLFSAVFALGGTLAAQGAPAEDTTLANGVRVIVVERPALPLVTLAVYVRGGLLLDTPETFRHASLAMGCLWMGHADLDEDAVRRALGDIGADYASYVDLEDARVHVSCMAAHAPRALELLAGAILQPTFADAVVVREREREQHLLEQRRKLPEHLAQQAFVRAVVGDHPLATAFSLEDTAGALAQTDHAALRAEWQRLVQPQLATVLVVGRVAPDLVAAVRQRFGAWPRVDAPTTTEVRPPAARAPAQRLIKVSLPEMSEVYLQLGTLGPPPDAALAPAVQVLRLATAGGFTSSLEDELRVNRGLVYGISFSSPSLTFAAPASLVTRTRPDKVREVLDVTARLLRDAGAGKLTPAQLEAARNMWLGSRALAREPQLGLADSVYRSLRQFGDLDGGRREADAVRGATPEQVANAGKLFDPAHFVVVMVGSPGDLAQLDWQPPD